MKRALIFFVAATLLVSFGCGEKQDKQEKQQQDTRAVKEEVKHVRKANSLVDPVDKTMVENYETSPWSYVYKDVEYRFNSEENYKAFKEDPEKYLND